MAGELAAQLVQEGVTEDALWAVLKLPCASTLPDTIKTDLRNKHRDVARCGFTFNIFGQHCEY